LVRFQIWTSAANQITAIMDDAKISLEDSTAVVTEALLNRKTKRLVSVSRMMRCNSQQLMTGPERNREFCFLIISMFPETKSRDTLSGSNRWKTNDHFTDK